MFCQNCGNKLCDEAAVCTKCGVFVSNVKKSCKKKKKKNVSGIISIIFGIVSLISSIFVMVIDISDVGMYVNLFDRLLYALDFLLLPAFIAFIAFLFAMCSDNRNKNSNITGLILSLLSFFFLLTELVVVMIY